MDKQIKVKADFSGGLDLVFNGKPEITLHVREEATVADVIKALATEHAN